MLNKNAIGMLDLRVLFNKIIKAKILYKDNWSLF